MIYLNHNLDKFVYAHSIMLLVKCKVGQYIDFESDSMYSFKNVSIDTMMKMKTMMENDKTVKRNPMKLLHLKLNRTKILHRTKRTNYEWSDKS